MKTDVGWKFVIDYLLPQFIEFFMPDLYEKVDFSISPKSLDNEFRTLFPESESNDRRVDKLFEVHLKNGENKWILLNIEVQSYEDENFAKRMYQHYARIFDKFDREIEAIVVYTYKVNRHKYKKYKSKFLGTKLTYEFRAYDIALQKIEELAKIKNPFSFVVQALIKGFEHKESDQNNFDFKKELLALLLKSGYSIYEAQRLFVFMNFILEIKDKKLRAKFYSEVIEMSTAVKGYRELTEFEEFAIEVKLKEEKMEIAKKLKTFGMDLKEIAHATGLSIEEIESL